MNEQTTKLIEQLAEKLGTTTQYLWSVLLKQAPVSATINILYILLVIGMGFFLLRLHKFFSNEDGRMSYDDQGEYLGVPMFIAGVVWAIIAIAAFFSVDDIITGYLNPEFWAIDYIMDVLKTKE